MTLSSRAWTGRQSPMTLPISRGVTPSASKASTSRSSETLTSPASMRAKRDWLVASPCATSAWVRWHAIRRRLSSPASDFLISRCRVSRLPDLASGSARLRFVCAMPAVISDSICGRSWGGRREAVGVMVEERSLRVVEGAPPAQRVASKRERRVGFVLVAARGVSRRRGASRCGSESAASDQVSDRGRIRPSREPVRQQVASKRERRLGNDHSGIAHDRACVAGLVPAIPPRDHPRLLPSGRPRGKQQRGGG